MFIGNISKLLVRSGASGKSMGVIVALFIMAGIVAQAAVERSETQGELVAESTLKVHWKVEDTKREFASTRHALEAVVPPGAGQERVRQHRPQRLGARLSVSCRPQRRWRRPAARIGVR